MSESAISAERTDAVPLRTVVRHWPLVVQIGALVWAVATYKATTDQLRVEMQEFKTEFKAELKSQGSDLLAVRVDVAALKARAR